MAEWGSAATILIFADSPTGEALAVGRVDAMGGRIAAALPIEQAIDRLDKQVAVDLVIVDIDADHGAMLDHLLNRIEQGAALGSFAAIVVVAPHLVDIVAARITHGAVLLLVGRDADALDLAIAERMQSSRLQLHDKKDDDHDQPIQHLLDALARFGHGLAALPDLDTPDGGQPSEPSMREIGDLPADAGVIRDMIRARRLRDELFGPGLFADPAWDILLDLTAARIEGRSVAVSSLCIAAAVPATTALRWIKQLTEAGLLRRVADPDDGRRIFIELSDDAARMMANYFASAARPPKS